MPSIRARPLLASFLRSHYSLTFVRSITLSTHTMSSYTPPPVWKWEKPNGGQFANINSPIAGPRNEKVLPVGDHALQLYSLGTPNGQKITILLEELIDAGKLDEYDAWLIKIGDGDQFGSEFTQVNPNSKIPALVDRSVPGGPLNVFESGSILVYLAEKYDAFLPKDVRKRTEVLNWLFWQVGSAPYVGGGFGHFYSYADEKLEYPINRFALETKRQLDVLNRHLATRSFIAADELTVADIAIWPWYGSLVLGRSYEGSSRFLSTDEYTHVIEWAKRLDARAAFKRGRIVNKLRGPLEEQLHERHSRQDFETKTQDKIEAAQSKV